MNGYSNIINHICLKFTKNKDLSTTFPTNGSFHKTQNNSREKKTSKRQWVIASVIIPTIATIVIPLLIYYLSYPFQNPKFIIANSILRPDTTLVIKANNKKANQKKHLDIFFDGCSFAKKGVPAEIDSKGMQQWHFKLKKHTTINYLIKDGKHKVKVGFPGEKLSNENIIIFISTPPVVRVEKKRKQGQTKIKGQITTELQLPKNILSVDITYFHKGETNEINSIPLKTKVHPESGITYYEFETILHGLPLLKPKDLGYSDPFWRIEVTDQAGNKYFHEQSYAKFMAPGIDKVGVSNIANIKIERLSEDITKQLKNIIRIIPNPTLIDKLKNGKPPIDLKVSSYGSAAKLEWKYNIASIEPLTLVYKNNKKIGASITNEYIDYSIINDAKYRVEQKSNQVIYRSIEKKVTILKSINTQDNMFVSNMTSKSFNYRNCFLRTDPATLFEKEVKSIIKRYNFYAKDINDNGSFENDFIDNNDMTITDQLTGLIWQKSGSVKYMKYSDAVEYIINLNENKFAGYNNWRIPTLDELMSLMEKKKNILHISELFSSKQRWCWSSDKYDNFSNRWSVGFNYGKVAYNSQEQGSFVRAVRCNQ